MKASYSKGIKRKKDTMMTNKQVKVSVKRIHSSKDMINQLEILK